MASLFGGLLYNYLQPWQTPSLAIYCEAIGACFDPWYLLVVDQGLDDGSGFYIPGYGSLFNVDTCPFKDLGYIGQYVGVPLPSNVSDAAARALIRNEAGISRGTVPAIRSAIERNLSYPVWAPSTLYASGDVLSNAGVYYTVTTAFTSPTTFNTTNLRALPGPPLISTQYTLIERQNLVGQTDAYQITLIVRPEQLTPSGNATALLNAINDVKPGGIIVNVAQSDSLVWGQLTHSWATLTGSWNTLNG